MCIRFHFLFHYGLSRDIECSSLCSTVGPCCLSILYILIVVCISSSFTFTFRLCEALIHKMLRDAPRQLAGKSCSGQEPGQRYTRWDDSENGRIFWGRLCLPATEMSERASSALVLQRMIFFNLMKDIKYRQCCPLVLWIFEMCTK